MKYYTKQYKLIEKDEKLAYEDPLTIVDPFINKDTGLMHIKGRIGFNAEGFRDNDFLQQHSTHYLILLPPFGSFVRAYLLQIHQRNNCATARFMLLVVRENFYLPRPLQTCKSAIRRCMMCMKRRSLNKTLNVPIGNLPAYRIPSGKDSNHNRPYNVIFFDIKGPLSLVNDTYKAKERKPKKQTKETNNEEVTYVKAYVIVFTCAMTRHSTLDTIENKSYEAVKNSFVRFINRWGTPSLCISDCDSSFKALSRDYVLEDIKWLDGLDKSDEFRSLELNYNIEFRFNTPNSPQLQSLVERINKIIIHSLLKLTQSNIKMSQLRTLLSTNEAMLNKRTLGTLNEDNPDEMRVVSPHQLITGYELRVSPKFVGEKGTVVPKGIQTKEEVIRHSRHLQSLIQRSWTMFLTEYVNGLNAYKKKENKHRPLVIGDIVLYSGRGERLPVNEYILCRVQEIMGRKGEQRSINVKTVKGGASKSFTRPLDHFCLLEISDFDAKEQLKQ